MIGLGYLGNGVSSSSSSNLSPLAPPFTVDRSNSKPISNPLMHLSEPQQYPLPFSSPLNNWQYPHSSSSRVDFFSNRDSEIDSIRTTSLASPNDYRYEGSESINPTSNHWPTLNPIRETSTKSLSLSYIGEPKPYYTPYVSPVIDDDTPLVALNQPSYDLLSNSGFLPMDGSSQVDCTQSLSGLEYAPQWGGLWNGLAEGKRKEVDGGFCSDEINVSGSLPYNNYVKQGACEVDSAISHGKYVDVFGRENRAGSSSAVQLHDKSFLPQNRRSIPVESSKTPMLRNGSMLSESHAQAPTREPATVSWNHQNPYSPYEKQFKLFDSSMNDCSSVTKSSPALSVRPPAVVTPISALHTVSSTAVDIGSVSVNGEDVDNLLKKTGGIEGFSDINQLSFFIDRKENNISVAPSSTKEEMSSKVLNKNASGYTFKARPGFHVSDINVPDGFSLTVESTEAIKSTTNSSESLDSPCWKGAPAAHFSSFDVFEAASPQHFMKKLEACHGLNRQGIQIFPPYNDSVKASSRELCEKSGQNENICLYNGSSLSPDITSDTYLPTKEHKSDDAVKGGSDCSKLSSSKGVQSCNDIKKPRNKYDLPNESKLESDSKPSQTKQLGLEEDSLMFERKLKSGTTVVGTEKNTNDASEDGTVAFHSVESVSCLPSSGEETGMLEKTHGRESTPKMDVQMLVNAMHNLSELLLFHCSNDACALNKQDSEALKHVIGNLDACMSKKIVHMTPTQEPTFPLQVTAPKLGVLSDLHRGAINEAGTHSRQLDSQFIPEQRRNDVSGKKVEKSVEFFSLRDDADVSKDHNMVQAIKKVLDENFQFEEELQSQATLYKNLWLEAEAELCSTSYRTRFDRVKIEMEKCKLGRAKDVLENTSVGKLSSSKVSPDPNIIRMSTPESSKVSPDPNVTHTLTPEANDSLLPKTSISSAAISRSNSHVDDVEASVMARFQILKCRGNNSNTVNVEEQQLPDVDDAVVSGQGSVMARFQILKRRGNNSNTINVEEQQLPDVHDAVFSGEGNDWPIIRDEIENKSFDVAVGPRFKNRTGNGDVDEFGYYVDDPEDESAKEFHVCVTDDPVVQPRRNNGLQTQHSSGWYYNSSLDWEHVLKDDFAFQK